MSKNRNLQTSFLKERNNNNSSNFTAFLNLQTNIRKYKILYQEGKNSYICSKDNTELWRILAVKNGNIKRVIPVLKTIDKKIIIESFYHFPCLYIVYKYKEGVPLETHLLNPEFNSKMRFLAVSEIIFSLALKNVPMTLAGSIFTPKNIIFSENENEDDNNSINRASGKVDFIYNLPSYKNSNKAVVFKRLSILIEKLFEKEILSNELKDFLSRLKNNKFKNFPEIYFEFLKISPENAFLENTEKQTEKTSFLKKVLEVFKKLQPILIAFIATAISIFAIYVLTRTPAAEEEPKIEGDIRAIGDITLSDNTSDDTDTNV